MWSSEGAHSCSCSVASWGQCCVAASLKRGQNCRMGSGGLSAGWSFIRVVPHQGGPSSGWSFFRVVFHQGGLSSGWSLIGVFFHQRFYYTSCFFPAVQVNGKYVLKSGTDFRNCSKLTFLRNGVGWTVDIERVDLTSDFPEDPELKAVVGKMLGVFLCRFKIKSSCLMWN